MSPSVVLSDRIIDRAPVSEQAPTYTLHFVGEIGV